MNKLHLLANLGLVVSLVIGTNGTARAEVETKYIPSRSHDTKIEPLPQEQGFSVIFP